MKKAIDLTGQRFGRLVVMKQTGRTEDGDALWLCKCDCGNEHIARSSSLRHGNSKSCGCYAKEYRFKDLTGQKYGRWTVLEFDCTYKRPSGQIVRMWKCECECGTIRSVDGSKLKGGVSLSCGCRRHEITIQKNRTHGMARTRIYKIWQGMKQRCNNSKEDNYRNYGGRGIKVCKEWERDFVAFRDWALNNGYSDELSIDRIDNNKGYSPENCRWANVYVQGNNRRTNHYLEWNGERKTITEWSKDNPLNLKEETIRSRMNNGWSTDAIFTTPLRLVDEETYGRMITINGRTKNLKSWCKEYGICVATYYQRKRKGMSDEEAIIKPKDDKEYKNQHIKINGIEHDLQTWCSECGIPKGTYYSRLRNGWSKEEALTIPHGGKRNIKLITHETYDDQIEGQMDISMFLGEGE